MVASYYWPAVGGVESYLRHVARGLARRHDVQVIVNGIDSRPTSRLSGNLAPLPSFEPFTDDGVAVRQLRIPLARRVALAPLALQVVPGARRYSHGRARRVLTDVYERAVGPVIAELTDGADVRHVWSADFLAAATVRAGRIAARPTVITPFVHPGQWNDDAGSAHAYRRADRVIGLLETDADVLRGLGAPTSAVRVCGVCSPGVPPGAGRALRDAHAIAGPLVLFLGVRRPYKGFQLLLEAAHRLPAGGADVTVAFVGPGPAIESAAAGGGASILDIGAVDDVEKAAWLDAADLLCLPSEGEIFPVSILEAWSVGTPILVSDIPPLRELVTRTGGGQAVVREAGALAAAISELLGDPTRLRAMGARGHEAWLREFTVDAVVAWHEREYEQVAAGDR
jgi:phosphatidylinositol alpha-1,6-mannosyltransferase